MKSNLINSIRKRNATICVIGCGYVGLPLALRFAEKGFSVFALDTDETKVSNILDGKSYIDGITDRRIERTVAEGLVATSKFSVIKNAQAVIICVPTPLSSFREPDLSHVEDVLRLMEPYLNSGQLISFESTSYPGTTDEIFGSALKRKNFIIGENIFLAYSPEREDPGNSQYTTANIPKVVSGYTPACLEVGLALYECVVNEVVAVSTTKVAELTKLLENIHRSVNIGLVNEMKIIADKMDIDIFEVINAAATKPFGFSKYLPGPGLGGHCIPVDPYYLSWKAREYGIATKFIELAGEINRNMPVWVIGKVVDALNSRHQAVSGTSILVLGVAYKKDVADVRESPGVEIIKKLLALGAIVSFSDPVCDKDQLPPELSTVKQVEVTVSEIRKNSLLLIVTDHTLFDYDLILFILPALTVSILFLSLKIMFFKTPKLRKVK
mgnify:CR=1 FL=1